MSESGTPGNDDPLVEEGEVAGDYLESLLDILDYDGDIEMDVVRDRASVSIEGSEELRTLVGETGDVLEALQELTRLAVQQETGSRSKLLLDIGGWRRGRREELTRVGEEAARVALTESRTVTLEAMTPFERKVVHDAIAGIDGVHSDSEGEEPRRHVVVTPDTSE